MGVRAPSTRNMMTLMTMSRLRYNGAYALNWARRAHSKWDERLSVCVCLLMHHDTYICLVILIRNNNNKRNCTLRLLSVILHCILNMTLLQFKFTIRWLSGFVWLCGQKRLGAEVGATGANGGCAGVSRVIITLFSLRVAMGRICNTSAVKWALNGRQLCWLCLVTSRDSKIFSYHWCVAHTNYQLACHRERQRARWSAREREKYLNRDLIWLHLGFTKHLTSNWIIAKAYEEISLFKQDAWCL